MNEQNLFRLLYAGLFAFTVWLIWQYWPSDNLAALMLSASAEEMSGKADKIPEQEGYETIVALAFALFLVPIYALPWVRWCSRRVYVVPVVRNASRSVAHALLVGVFFGVTALAISVPTAGFDDLRIGQPWADAAAAYVAAGTLLALVSLGITIAYVLPAFIQAGFRVLPLGWRIGVQHLPRPKGPGRG